MAKNCSKYTQADRDALVAYAELRKMPKVTINKYKTGDLSAEPLAQLVLDVRTKAEAAATAAADKLKASVKDLENAAAGSASTIETQVNIISALRQDLSVRDAKLNTLRGALVDLQSKLGGWWISTGKLKAIVTAALAVK